MKSMPPEGVFWGKFIADKGLFLSLLNHSIDVAVVFRALCDVEGIHRSLSRATRTHLTPQHLDRLAVLAMLHDIGKANLGFQNKIKPNHKKLAGHIQELTPFFDDQDLNLKFINSLPQGIVTCTWFVDGISATNYLYAIFSHHGRPVKFHAQSKTRRYWQARNKWWKPDKNKDPFAAISEISTFAQEAFPGAFLPNTSPLPEEAAFQHRFAGLVMLADWLGSHNHWFPVEEVNPIDRLAHGRKVAPEMLKAVGISTSHFRQGVARIGQDFLSRFGFSPYPLQKLIDDLDPEDPNTILTIAESETGSGKTEAALNWFSKLFEAGKVDGLYFALPTRVAARELYQRINGYIKKWFPDQKNRPITLLAVPGYAQVDGYSVKELIPDTRQANMWQEDSKALFLERFWACEIPKRYLAATIAVGTIDQALLSIVQTPHSHLRSVCLDRSLLVVDEVHASDLYMSQLLKSLLTHHLGVGGYAMLLSATLGARAQKEYVNIASPGEKLPDLKTTIKAPYPCLTLVNGQKSMETLSSQAKKVHFHMKPWAFEPEKIIDQLLLPALKAGARVLVVMNTVARAVDMLKAIEAKYPESHHWLFKCNGEICPHHGRFTPEDREILDKAVSETLGKGSKSRPIVLVGTQTLEQSLDIDADLMITDLAPSDVLLQRVGRLHRHKRIRPPAYNKPRCIVLIPDVPLESGLDSRGDVASGFKRIGYGSVYEDLRTLELTIRMLRQSPEVTIPDDNRWLVEMTTHPEALAILDGQNWHIHASTISGRELAKEITASHVVNVFDEDFTNITYHDVGRSVATRLGSDSLRFSLERSVQGPFGRQLKEIVIPDYMAPKKASFKDDVILVEKQVNKTTYLGYGNYRYQYSRYGLEEIK